MVFYLLGDDCIALNGGSYDINITSVTCGPGHGIRFAHIQINHLFSLFSNFFLLYPLTIRLE